MKIQRQRLQALPFFLLVFIAPSAFAVEGQLRASQ
jgi:hypothetical protein